jgi:hypothetical protein
MVSLGIYLKVSGYSDPTEKPGFRNPTGLIQVGIPIGRCQKLFESNLGLNCDFVHINPLEFLTESSQIVSRLKINITM